jgi:HD-GYP domain-containing protein (c-di-GMP phosphodiesterase class II)
MKLICIEGKEKDRSWELIHPRTVIGRDSVCDVVVNDMKLSRIHSEIIYEDDVYIYHDKESRNGSYINNDRVTRQILISGDQIRIGDTVFKALQDNLTPSIKWQEDNPLVTSKVPLNRLSDQLEEAVSPPEATLREGPGTGTKRQALIGKLLKNLETIYKVGNVINSIQTLDELLDQIAEMLLGVFKDVQRVCILLKEDEKKFEPKFIKNRGDDPLDSFHMSNSVINNAVEEKVCLLANDASRDGRFAASESVISLHLRSVMCAPLVSKGVVLGAIYLDNCEKPNCFDENDVALLSALANQSATAIENSRLYEDVQKAYHDSILALMNTVEAKDPYTRGHSQRTSRYALGIAQEMKLSEEECKKIKTAAELHDIGKIGVHDLIIGKESPLSTMEFQSIQAHALAGEKILDPIEYLKFALPMIRSHHEKYDGTGYPDGLKRDKIPLGARIIGAADTFDAMTTQRPYNDPLPFNKALEKCKALKGKQLDAKAVDALVNFVSDNYKTLAKTDEFPEDLDDSAPSKKKKQAAKKNKSN